MDELYHYGILGQKWGVRRYQNEDGTLTEAGKKRYSSLSTKRERLSEKQKKFEEKSLKQKKKVKGYFTDTGRAISEKHAYKSIKFEGKALRIGSKIVKLDQKMYKLIPMTSEERNAVLKSFDLNKKYSNIIEEIRND